jgi:hypothetical protein
MKATRKPKISKNRSLLVADILGIEDNVKRKQKLKRQAEAKTELTKLSETIRNNIWSPAALKIKEIDTKKYMANIYQETAQKNAMLAIHRKTNSVASSAARHG